MPRKVVKRNHGARRSSNVVGANTGNNLNAKIALLLEISLKFDYFRLSQDSLQKLDNKQIVTNPQLPKTA